MGLITVECDLAQLYNPTLAISLGRSEIYSNINNANNARRDVCYL